MRPRQRMITSMSNSKGFTFIELMVTVSLLSIGTMMIYPSNLSSLATYGRYTHRLDLQNWAEEKIWEAKQGILEAETPETNETTGVFSAADKAYNWQLNVKLMWKSDDSKVAFYQIVLTVSWQEGGQRTFLSRAASVQKVKL